MIKELLACLLIGFTNVAPTVINTDKTLPSNVEVNGTTVNVRKYLTSTVSDEMSLIDGYYYMLNLNNVENTTLLGLYYFELYNVYDIDIGTCDDNTIFNLNQGDYYIDMPFSFFKNSNQDYFVIGLDSVGMVSIDTDQQTQDYLAYTGYVIFQHSIQNKYRDYLFTRSDIYITSVPTSKNPIVATFTSSDLGWYTQNQYNNYGTQRYNQGFGMGVDAVVANPHNYDLYDETDYLNYGTQRYNAGITQGQNNVINNPHSYNLKTQAEYNAYGIQEYNSGYSDGEDAGIEEVQENPHDYDLYTEAEYNVAYNQGQADSNLMQNGFKTLVGTIFNAPYNILNGMLNFELFGVNLFNLLSFVFSIILISIIVKIFI